MPLIARQLGALALLIAVLVLIDRSAASAQYTLTNNIVNPSDVRELFARDIREFGGVDAYARLAFAMQGLEIEEQHEYAHTFGHELYAVEGEQGIGACDARFAFGCFHQFLGEAIGDLGTTSVGRLYDACATITGTRRVCQHGIGHGVLSAIGYDEADLKGALELCNSVTRERTYAGCVGGAFMEYNLRIIASAEGIQGPREFSGDMYAPCTSVSSLDQKTCTFWLPQWWLFFVLHNDRTHSADNPAYKSMKKLCEESPYPQSCYEGIGYITPTAFAYDPGDIRNACDALGERGSTYCRGMAALIVNLTKAIPGSTTEICDGLPEHPRDICVQYAAHDNDFSFSVPPTS